MCVAGVVEFKVFEAQVVGRVISAVAELLWKWEGF